MVKKFLKNIWNKVTLMVSMFILSTVSSTLYSFGKVRVIVEFYLKNTDLHHRFNVTSVFLEEDL